ncbi:spidroin-2 [Nilaparvata lugens]|uniref:spidroin-2 n=1 Tax=Nilaparvata lugens TaxID=108931 RepID=UPI00193EAAA4|nr:spidroin-2 [Nilaparvata lugens]
MNTWNQWGAAPGAATVAAGYQNAAAAAAGANPGMAGASAGMVFPGAANPAATNAAAAAALTPYAAMGAYGYYGNAAMPPGYGAQWPGAAAAPGAGAGGVGPVAGGAAAQWQQTQWEQWQQQYAQWQQQYGAKMPGMPPTQPQPVSSAPSATDQNQAVSAPSSDTTVRLRYKYSSIYPLHTKIGFAILLFCPRSSLFETLEELIEAEKAFDVQFKNWESQFEKWKEQNINHPDKMC